jgi:hypothetical protein
MRRFAVAPEMVFTVPMSKVTRPAHGQIQRATSAIAASKPLSQRPAQVRIVAKTGDLPPARTPITQFRALRTATMITKIAAQIGGYSRAGADWG